MSDQSQHLESIRDIRQLMEKSSRFISLSGLSGMAAGFCALAGAWFGRHELDRFHGNNIWMRGGNYETDIATTLAPTYRQMEQELILIAVVTFGAALTLSFLFTYLRSKKTGVPLWGLTARRVMFSVITPMIAGGLLILRLTDWHVYGLIAPCCLIFYGLGLISAGRYTFSEIRYLGIGQLVLGALNLWMIGYGLTFWAIGFGGLHIVYGFVMWWKYERGGRAREN